MLLLPTSGEKSVFTNSQNDSSALTFHNLGVGEKSDVWVRLVIIFEVAIFVLQKLRLTLLDLLLITLFRVDRLVNLEAHLVKNNAVSWHTVTFCQLDDVTDHKIMNWH